MSAVICIWASCGPQVRQAGERLAHVLQLRRRQVLACTPAVAARAMPTDTAALPSWNHGSTTLTIDVEPFALAADLVGRRDGDVLQPHRGAGVAAQPETGPRAGDAQPRGRLRHEVERAGGRLVAGGAAGRDDVAVGVAGARHPRLVGRDVIAVTALFFAWLTGAQKWLREPFSLNASVDRCLPAAMSFSTGIAAAKHRCRRDDLRAADVHQVDHAVEAHCSASLRRDGGKRPRPLPGPAVRRRHGEPEQPGLGMASMLSAGQRACRSTSAACLANTSRATVSAFAIQVAASLMVAISGGR